MNCQTHRERMSDLLDGLLGPQEEARLREHIASCDDCRRHYAALEKTVGLLQSLPAISTPRDLTSAIQNRTTRRRRPFPALTLLHSVQLRAAMAAMIVLAFGLFAYLRYGQPPRTAYVPAESQNPVAVQPESIPSSPPPPAAPLSSLAEDEPDPARQPVPPPEDQAVRAVPAPVPATPASPRPKPSARSVPDAPESTHHEDADMAESRPVTPPARALSSTHKDAPQPASRAEITGGLWKHRRTPAIEEPPANAVQVQAPAEPAEAIRAPAPKKESDTDQQESVEKAVSAVPRRHAASAKYAAEAIPAVARSALSNGNAPTTDSALYEADDRKTRSQQPEPAIITLSIRQADIRTVRRIMSGFENIPQNTPATKATSKPRVRMTASPALDQADLDACEREARLEYTIDASRISDLIRALKQRGVPLLPAEEARYTSDSFLSMAAQPTDGPDAQTVTLRIDLIQTD